MVEERHDATDFAKRTPPELRTANPITLEEPNSDPSGADRVRQVQSAPRSSGGTLNDIASGLALVLSVFAFFLSGFALLQMANMRRQVEGVRSPTSSAVTNSFAGTGGGSTPSNSTQSGSFVERVRQSVPSQAQTIEPGKFVQATLEGNGQVEILSAERTAEPANLVNLRVRFERASRSTGSPPSAEGGDNILLGDAIALNTRTNRSFPVVDFQTAGDEPISLERLRPGESTEATLAFRVPADLERVDVRIPGTNVFRNVPISSVP
ncbi:MAG: hypothetical protein KME43_00260 [Myxacorys chilensis ATA2-1-KO14]|jgi:hypothetical protein|nr:hypothetical protein [Myxacorys chilensis ATA2-1-KO14]